MARLSHMEGAKRERLNTIIGQLRDGVVAVDMDERIEILNPAMARLLERPAAALIGHKLSDIAPELSLHAPCVSHARRSMSRRSWARERCSRVGYPLRSKGRRPARC